MSSRAIIRPTTPQLIIILIETIWNLLMSDDLKLEGVPIAMELIPVAIQITGIAALLILTLGESTHSIAAIVLSLTWLKVSQSEMPEEYGKLRAARHLYGKLGGWLNQEDGESIFDVTTSKYLLIDGSIQDDQYRAVITAAGLANGIRGFASFVIHAYLLFVLLIFLLALLAA